MVLRRSASQSKAGSSAEVDQEFDARPSSVAAVRRAVVEAAKAAHLPSEQVQALHIAAGEAATNVVEHAYGTAGGTIHLRTSLSGSLFHVEVSDRGQWRETAARVMAGRGIPIMRALVDKLHISREVSGTTVRLSVRTA